MRATKTDDNNDAAASSNEFDASAAAPSSRGQSSYLRATRTDTNNDAAASSSSSLSSRSVAAASSTVTLPVGAIAAAPPAYLEVDAQSSSSPSSFCTTSNDIFSTLLSSSSETWSSNERTDTREFNIIDDKEALDVGRNFDSNLEKISSAVAFAVEFPYNQCFGSSLLKENLQMEKERLSMIQSTYLIPQLLNAVQLTVCNRLDIPHGHVERSSYLVSCRTKNVNVINVHPSEQLMPNQPVQFIELKKEKKDLMKTLQDIAAYLMSRSIKEGDLSGGLFKRQRHYQDVGFASNRNTSRENSQCGTSSPRKLDQTDDPFFLNLFKKFSNVIDEHCCWLWNMEKERINNYAGTIVKGNLIEAMRIAMNLIIVGDFSKTKDYFCKFHTDDFNDEHFPGVAVVSGVIWMVPNVIAARVSVIFYTRNSIHASCRRISGEGELIKFMKGVLRDDFETWRQCPKLLLEYLYDTSNPITDRCTDGRGYYLFRCHLNPFVVLSPWINAVINLHRKFLLDYVEVTSVLRAFASHHHTTYYAHVAAEILLEKGLNKLAIRRGINFGLDLLKLMLLLEKKRDGKIPGLRYQENRLDELPSEHHWFAEIRRTILIQLQSWLVRGGSSSKERYSFYKKMFNEYNRSQRWVGCGRLGINAFLGSSAIIGTIPLYYADEYHNGQQSPSFKHFASLANLKTSAEACNRVFTSLAFDMMNSNLPGSKRFSEHCFCKVLRKINCSEDNHNDLLFFGNSVYSAYDQRLYIYQPPTKCRTQISTRQDHGLIWKWGFGNKTMNLIDIAQIAKVENLDITKDCDEWVIPLDFDCYH